MPAYYGFCFEVEGVIEKLFPKVRALPHDLSRIITPRTRTEYEKMLSQVLYLCSLVLASEKRAHIRAGRVSRYLHQLDLIEKVSQRP